MQLQTQIPLQPAKQPIDYRSRVLFMGSCFSEHIGAKMEAAKFRSETNPLGIVFHPLAIEKLLARAINTEVYTEADLFFHNEQWHCFEAHSVLSHTSKELCLKHLNDGLSLLNTYVSEVSHIFLTYGTAWVYRYMDSDTVVANCHKVPQKKFVKELLSVEEVRASTERMVALLKNVNPTVQIIGTVSPVRHLKDGFVENSRSKAHLLAGLHAVIEEERGTHYFPSYELMMDQLRDYRFYAEDMLHPTSTAIQLIWEHFTEVWISKETKNLREQIEAIQRGIRHRAFNEESEAHQKFLAELQQKIVAVREQLPHIQF